MGNRKADPSATAGARRMAVLTLLQSRNSSMTANQIGYNLYRQKLIGGRSGGKGNYSLAATAILRSMQRDGIVAKWRAHGGNWRASPVWALTKAGRKEAQFWARCDSAEIEVPGRKKL